MLLVHMLSLLLHRQVQSVLSPLASQQGPADSDKLQLPSIQCNVIRFRWLFTEQWVQSPASFETKNSGVCVLQSTYAALGGGGTLLI